MVVIETRWQPPAWCLIWLTGFVTLVALAAVVLSTILVLKSLSTGDPPLVVAFPTWLLYLAVAATCLKAMTDWIRIREVR